MQTFAIVSAPMHSVIVDSRAQHRIEVRTRDNTNVATILTLNTTTTKAPFGTPVILTANVRANMGTNIPTGTITFKEGTGDSTNEIGKVTVDNQGNAKLDLSKLAKLPDVGKHTFTAEYTPATGSGFDKSGPEKTEVEFEKASVSIAVSGEVPGGGSLENLTYGQPVTFTATVTPLTPSTAPVNEGSANFELAGRKGKEFNISVPVKDGKAVLTTQNLPGTSDSAPENVRVFFTDRKSKENMNNPAYSFEPPVSVNVMPIPKVGQATPKVTVEASKTTVTAKEKIMIKITAGPQFPGALPPNGLSGTNGEAVVTLQRELKNGSFENVGPPGEAERWPRYH